MTLMKTMGGTDIPTALNLTHGVDFDRQLAAQIRAQIGVPAVTAAGALISRLQAVAAKRITLCGRGKLTPAQNVELARQADQPDPEAIVMACTDLRAVEAIAKIETALEKPVITSNQAMVFAARQVFGG